MERVNTVVVTGGAGHLGRAVARSWTKPGVNLVLLDRDADRLEACRIELAASDANIIAAEADLTKPDEIAAIARSLPAVLWSSPPSLVITHGVAGRSGSTAPRIGELNHNDWREAIEGNLTSVVFVIQAFLPLMKAAGGGRVVLVASAAGLAASPTAALSYSVAKAGVAALPRLLAPELGAFGVLINAVAPGKFVNPDWPDTQEQIERYAGTVPLGRLASTVEVASLIGFLASEANTYITGQTILQDGGRLSGLTRGGRQ